MPQKVEGQFSRHTNTVNKYYLRKRKLLPTFFDERDVK